MEIEVYNTLKEVREMIEKIEQDCTPNTVKSPTFVNKELFYQRLKGYLTSLPDKPFSYGPGGSVS